MGNESEMDVDVNSSARIRQYPVGHNGPYIVIIRRKELPLESKKINKYVFTRFKHVQKITQENEHKIKIVFGEKNEKSAIVVANSSGDDITGASALIEEDVAMSVREKKLLEEKLKCAEKSAREEANELPKYEEWNKKYFVYIPEKLVETKAVISWPVGSDVNEMTEDFCTGKFSNPSLSDVKVLEAVRLKKKSNEATNAMEETGTVIVTFEGLLLPKWLNFDKMLIPVREFRARQMYCENCHRYNHTKSRCNNKKLTPPAEIKCMQCNSNDHEGGSKECPKRKLLEKKVQQTTRQMRKKTYAEMLRELDPNSVMPNEISADIVVTPMQFPSRRTQATKRRQQQDSGPSESPQRKKKPPRDTSTTQDLPPGFQRVTEKKDEFADMIVNIILSMVKKMNLPTVVMQLIETYAPPFIYQIVESFTNTVKENFNLS